MNTSKGKALRPASLRVGAVSATALTAALAFMPAAAMAQQQDAEQLATVKVQSTAIEENPNAEEGVPYKAKTSGDERHTRPLAETPQTITVLTKAAIEDSGYTDLKQVLNAQPGISVGTGENGNAFGDRYIIRGQDARSDSFVDGLRDPGMNIRETFATEQVEITKGPNSSLAGRGSAGGAINAITKQATTLVDFANIQIGGGTDNYVRTTADLNKAFDDSIAIRANLLYAYQDVPELGPANRKRYGAAVSMQLTPSDNFEGTVDYYFLRAKDRPDVGSFLFNAGGTPWKNVPAYAQMNEFLKSNVDIITSRLKWKFSDDVRLTSLTRYGRGDNAYVLSHAGSAGTAGTTGVNNPGGVYQTPVISAMAHQGWQEVNYFANQENLFVTKDLFGRKNEFVATVEYTDNHVLNGTYSATATGAFNCITGAGTVLNAYCIRDSAGNVVPNLNNLLKRNIIKGGYDQNWQVKTWSASVIDTIDITDKLTAFAGVRYDSYDFSLGLLGTTCTGGTCYASDGLWNGHFGLTYKITPNLIVYGTYSSATDINGGESDVGSSSGYGGAIILAGEIPKNTRPERSENLEAGVKWNAFNQKVLFTAAAFQVTKSDVMEGNGYTAIGTYNSGENRVRGIELSVSGKIGDKLTVQGGATFMNAEVLKSATAANVGRTLSNFADNSAVLQAKYQLTDNFYFGGAVKYESERYGGQPDTAATFSAVINNYSWKVPAYTVGDVFASYRFNPKTEVRLNVNNVTNEDYYLAAYQAGFFLYRGDKRQVKLTLNYDF